MTYDAVQNGFSVEDDGHKFVNEASTLGWNEIPTVFRLRYKGEVHTLRLSHKEWPRRAGSMDDYEGDYSSDVLGWHYVTEDYNMKVFVIND